MGPNQYTPSTSSKFGGITMHKCRSYGPDKLNLLPFYHLTFKCDLDLQPTWTNVSNGICTLQGEQLCQIILKSMHKYRSYGQDKLNLWQFYHLSFMCDLDFQPTQTNVSNDTTTPQGEHLCKIILKTMHKCWRYGPDKFNLWPYTTIKQQFSILLYNLYLPQKGGQLIKGII